MDDHIQHSMRTVTPLGIPLAKWQEAYGIALQNEHYEWNCLNELARQQRVQPASNRSFAEFARVYSRLMQSIPQGPEPGELESKVGYVRSRITITALQQLGLWQKRLPFDAVMAFSRGACDAFKQLSAPYQEQGSIILNE
ncbi:hypothetical protein HY492_02220 [Candidatus Woesearchaeota archaeon]|nr:hypothetical protein [Candidatus Woesearchaeota archaeon]